MKSTVDYRSYPCTCSHAESTHRGFGRRCRGKNCKCPRFLNIAYVEWFERIVKSDMKLLMNLKLELLKRINKNAGFELVRLAPRRHQRKKDNQK